MRGVYTIDAKVSALAASKSLILLTAPAAGCVEILSARIGTSGTNVTNQQLEAMFKRVVTAGSPAGTSQTPSPQEHGDQAAGSTVLVNLTTEPGAYSTTQIYDHQGFPSLGGYNHDPVPENRIIVPPSGQIGLFLASTPSASDFDVSVTFREIG